jgi:hypothetical protein
VAIWPSIAYQHAVLVTSYRLKFEARFRRLDSLLAELKASEQQHR